MLLLQDDSIGLKPKLSERGIFFNLRGGNLKILIIYIYRTIFINFGKLFPDIITKLFNWIETGISERGPFYLCDGELNLKNYRFFYLRFDFS